MSKQNIKKGDTVKVLAGKEKGRSGKVLEVFPKENRLAVRFSRPKRRGEKGQRLELPGPMNVSKVMLICPNCGKPTRVAHDGGLRKCKKCGRQM
jgi:large subunit ribosomal protein L24